MGTNTEDFRNGFTADPDVDPHRRRRAGRRSCARSSQRGTDRSVVFDSISNGVPISVDVDTV